MRTPKGWICKTCTFVFQTFGEQKPQRKRYFCPNCGENIAVHRHRKKDKVKSERNYTKWTDDELLVVEKVLNGEMMIYQAAIKLGRTERSIVRRRDRMKEERN